jgi:N-acetylmuramoyl-L-alanine amidase
LTTIRTFALWGVLASSVVIAAPIPVQNPAPYTVITADSRRTLPVRASRSTEMASLDQLGTLFGFRVAEDAQVGGLTLLVRNRRILLIADQSFAQVDGQVRTLSAPVTRERNAWQVPIDFITEALAPVLGTRVEIRRTSRLIIVGDIRIPRVSGRVERAGDGARVVLDLVPAAPTRITREGNVLQIRIDAHALDMGTITGVVPGFVTATRVQGTTVQVALGPSVADFRPESSTTSPVTVDLLSAPAPPPPPQATPPPPSPGSAGPVDLTPPGVVRTIVIDPGHGGTEIGTVGAGGMQEKDLTLRLARRLKAAIESRIGLRVVLTREGDETVPLDRRSATANNIKADLFISLHANASPGGGLTGAQVLSLSLDDYAARAPRSGFGGSSVPAMGGGLRLIEAVPWDIAQVPYAARSATLAAVVVKHLIAQKVPMFDRPIDQLPLRVLVGANMPAVQIEVGFLSNAGEEQALGGQDRPGAIVEALLAALAEVRSGIPVAGRGRGNR